MGMKQMVLGATALVACGVFAADEPQAESFSWTHGQLPTGWISTWGGENETTNQAARTVVAPSGAAETLHRTITGWHPWANVSYPDAFTFGMYGCTDFMQPADGERRVLVSLGTKAGQKYILTMDDDRHVRLYSVSGQATGDELFDAGELKGYHLFTIGYSKTDGVTFRVDDGETQTAASSTTKPAGGLQIGSIHGGVFGSYVKGVDYLPVAAFAYDTTDLTDETWTEIFAAYPAVTTFPALTYSVKDGTLYVPSLTMTTAAKEQLRIQQGTLEIVEGIDVAVKSFELGDQQGNPSFGANIAGTLTVTATQSPTTNDYNSAYKRCNNGYGVVLGEWTGYGTVNVTGTFDASGAIVELCHDSTSVAVNVAGGTFRAAGVTSRCADRASITLTGGGTIDYGKFASCEVAINKTYGAGTVTGTADWNDSDAIMLTDAETGTTFLADGITQTYLGAISGDGKAVIDARNDGAVVFAADEFTAAAVDVVSGTLTLTYDDVDALTIGSELLGGAIVTVAEGATLEVKDLAAGLAATVSEEGKLVITAENIEVTHDAVLRISEIMPKPVDKPVSDANPASLERMDLNGLESGWVEVENTSATHWADLADYKFIRTNRSKKTSEGYGNFPSVLIAPGKKYVFYTSERYSNSADMTVSAWATPHETPETPVLYGADLHNMLVWPDKVNPKKFPFVRFIHAPEGGTETIVDTVVIPYDIPEGHAIIVDPVEKGKATTRWLTANPTRGKANAAEDLVALGPNAGPLYEIEGQKKHNSASEFARVAAPAKLGEDYAITFSLNPTMHPTEVATNRAEDAIASITLVYRSDLGEEKSVAVDMMTAQVDASDWGNSYTATIPADDLPAAGHLIQWKFTFTDASGNTWTTPSFHNTDDGYEWYGTIVEPTEDQTSATLPTWHMFVDDASKAQMDKDTDDQDLTVVPHNARVAIYDASTSNYYDYVRIDLRGNTSKNFTKKSHGLRFAKAHPLTMTDIVSGETIKEIRKSSLVGEPADPSYMRQMMSFWLWNKMGNNVPFDFPVRCNLNGEFFQLAFHSERFTDELIEDVYGFDKFGYGYKNVGTLKSGSGTTSGGIEKKTPDDGNESDVTVLQNELRAKITAAQNVTEDTTGESTEGLDNADLTAFVVEKFDLPAWLNYLASARITQEMDDVWANVSIYYDNAEMMEGTRGTGTWIPLGYDFNLSLGQYYFGDVSGVSRFGLMANQDWFKSHPFYGGNRVRCYKQEAMSEKCNNGNDGFEAVWQNAKFRRLYLRRLRTLMDQELKVPGTDESEVPLMVKMREMANLMRADATLDRAKYPRDDGGFSVIDVWGSSLWPTNMDAAIDEIWNDYIVPRRKHLYVTHSVTNTAREIGYATGLNAGIPEAQSPLATLAAGLSATYDESIGAVIIANANAEVIDLSGWTLKGPVEMTLPPGTVLDQAADGVPGEVYVTADRRATVAAMTVTDQVVVGNGTAGTSDVIRLLDPDGNAMIFGTIVNELGASAALAATTEEAALAEAATYVIELTAEDIAAGLETTSLSLAVEPVYNSKGKVTGYTAVIVVNEETVPAPAINEAAETPIDLASDADTIGLAVKDAKPGLWYGCTAADQLGDTFEIDASSFQRATDETLMIRGTRRSGTSGFYRIVVRPVKPE